MKIVVLVWFRVFYQFHFIFGFLKKSLNNL